MNKQIFNTLCALALCLPISGFADAIDIFQEVSSTGGGNSYGLQSSADGMTVAFLSDAPDLIGGVPSGRANLFRKDLSSGGIEWIEIDAPGRVESYVMSDDAERFALCVRRPLQRGATNPATADVYLWSESGGLTLISDPTEGEQSADHDCWDPWITSDGRFIFFKTRANNLLPGHFFGDYGFGVVRYDVESGALDTGVPVFSDGVDSEVHFSPDGNLVVTRQELPSTWEGESPFEGQATSRLVNVFKIDEHRVIIPPSSSDLPYNDLRGDASTQIRIDGVGEWVSVFSWADWPDQTDFYFEELFAFRVGTSESMVAPQILDDETHIQGAIAGGDYFKWTQDGVSGVWHRERGFMTGGAGVFRLLVKSSSVTSPDGNWIASSDNVATALEGRGWMNLWRLDSNDVVKFGPRLKSVFNPDSRYYEESFGQPNFVFSTDSRFLFFETAHPGFVENDTNVASDVFRYSIETGEILLISSRDPNLPVPRDGITVTAPVIDPNRKSRIFYRHSLDSDDPWIEAKTSLPQDGEVKFKDLGATFREQTFYKSELPRP